MRKLFWFVGREISRKAPEMQLSVLVNLYYLRFLVPAIIAPRLTSGLDSFFLVSVLINLHILF